MNYSRYPYLFGLLLAVCTLLPYNGNAQVKDVKKGSENNQQKSQSGNNSSTSSGNNSTGNNRASYNRNEGSIGQGCASACFDMVTSACMQGCIAYTGAALEQIGKDQRALIRKKDTIPELKMLELMPQAAYAPNNGTVTLLPRIRGVIGLFSTDLRVCQLADTRNSAENYSTFDWSVLQYALINTSFYHLRLGSGFMHERFSSIYFNEHFIGNDIKWSKHLNSNLEFRIAPDYVTGITARTEVSFRTNVEVVSRKPMHVYYTLGLLYQNYYQTIDFWSVHSGLLLRLQ